VTVDRPFRRFRQRVFDLALVGLVTLFAISAAGMYGPMGVAHGVAMAIPLGWRRRYPVAVFAVVAALAGAQLLVHNFMVMPHDVAVLMAMYSVVTYARRLQWGLLAGAVVLAGSALAGLSMPRSEEGWFLTTYLAVVSVGVWFLGLAVRNRRLYVRSLEERAATAERERDHLARIAVIEERARIARELHDIVAHSLSVMIVQADGAGYALTRDPARTAEAVRTIGITGRQALEEMRQLVAVLRDPGRGDAPADPTPTGWGQVTDAVERARAAGLTVELVVRGSPPEAPPGVVLAVRRIVQESLTNVLKHAGSRAQARLVLTYTPDRIEVAVDDDGGAQPGPARLPVGGHGLVGIRERVSLYGGEFTAGPRPDGGWRVRATLPVSPPSSRSEVSAAPILDGPVPTAGIDPASAG
jgi:signal transduction histidine kinase